MKVTIYAKDENTDTDIRFSLNLDTPAVAVLMSLKDMESVTAVNLLVALEKWVLKTNG